MTREQCLKAAIEAQHWAELAAAAAPYRISMGWHAGAIRAQEYAAKMHQQAVLYTCAADAQD